MARKKSGGMTLVKRGKMTQGEKDSLCFLYITNHGRRMSAEAAYEHCPWDIMSIKKLVARGLVRSVSGRGTPLTPQGMAVARMVLGLTRRKSRRRVRKTNPAREKIWRAYEIGWKAPAFGRIVERLGSISAPPDYPLGQLRMDAAREIDVPVKQVRLREMMRAGAKWI